MPLFSSRLMAGRFNVLGRYQGNVELAQVLPGLLMTAVYTYYVDDSVESVTFGNLASTWYTYEDARRLTAIEHRDSLGQVIRRLAYQYDDRDLLVALNEYDMTGWVAMTVFGYDNRGRLISESRSGDVAYQLSYEYDQGGNRTKKVDAINQIETVYHYDIEDPLVYDSNNNRLEYYETFDTSDPENPVLLSTTWYYYNESGNVTRVVTNQAGADQYESIRMGYAKNGQAVSYVMDESWTWTGAEPTEYDISYAHEYRYDNARQRYLDRTLNVEYLKQGYVGAVSELWTDYDGAEPYGDFTLNGDIVTHKRSFEPGLARTDDPLGGPATDYYHGDIIGTTRLMTDPSGLPIEPAVYTAFGERISGSMNGPENRYGYAGAWGYQSHDEFPFLHVGARYYDPETGRFLQRDPIGIYGGINVYEYVQSNPLANVDPDGQQAGTIPNPLGPWGGGDPVDDLKCVLYGDCPPPRPKRKYGGESPYGNTEEELERTKKEVFFLDFGLACSGALLGGMIGGPVGAIIGAVVGAGGGHVIDETVHIDEPLNPVIGGSYGPSG